MVERTLDEVQTQAAETMSSVTKRLGTSASIFKLESHMRRAEREAKKQLNSLIPSHAARMQLACTVMFMLTRYVTSGRGDHQRGAYAAVQTRATNDLLCVKRLLESGFEESARAITRSYLESIDLALACLGERSFADAYGADNVDADDFWKKQIGYGRIYAPAAKAMALAGLDQSTITEKIDRRRRQKQFLSRTVHGDFSSAFRSWAPSPLGYPDMVSLEPQGVISVHTPNHIACVVVETFEYCATIMKLVMSNSVTNVFNNLRSRRKLSAYSMHFFTLQALLAHHEFEDGSTIVAPDFSSSAE